MITDTEMKIKEKASLVVPWKDSYLFVNTGELRSLDFAGGGLKSGESPIVGALREGRQETGTPLTIARQIGQLFYVSQTRGRLCRAHLFLSNPLEEEPRIIFPDEIFGFERMDLDQVRQASRDGKLRYRCILPAMEFHVSAEKGKLFHICDTVPEHLREELIRRYK